MNFNLLNLFISFLSVWLMHFESKIQFQWKYDKLICSFEWHNQLFVRILNIYHFHVFVWCVTGWLKQSWSLLYFIIFFICMKLIGVGYSINIYREHNTDMKCFFFFLLFLSHLMNVRNVGVYATSIWLNTYFIPLEMYKVRSTEPSKFICFFSLNFSFATSIK